MGRMAKNLANRSPDPKTARTLDPRPELTEDSKLWDKLLFNAASYGPMLKSTLDGFRCAGTRIQVSPSGRYVMRPEISPGLCWESTKAYEDAKKKWLMPYAREINSLLIGLGGGAK